MAIVFILLLMRTASSLCISWKINHTAQKLTSVIKMRDMEFGCDNGGEDGEYNGIGFVEIS